MRLTKLRRIFQSRANHAVEAEMREPDQSVRRELWCWQNRGQKQEENWTYGGMHEVVQHSGEPHIDYVANQGDVRNKDKHGEQPPAKMPITIERQRSCKNCCAFRLQQPTRTRQHERECLLGQFHNRCLYSLARSEYYGLLGFALPRNQPGRGFLTLHQNAAAHKIAGSSVH